MSNRDATLWWVAGLTVLGDQLTKQLIVEYFGHSGSVTVVPDVLWLRYFRNPVGLFNVLANVSRAYRPLFSIVVPVIILVCLLFAFRRLDSGDVRFAAALSLIVGGAAGNLIDRILRRSVVDFIAINVGPVHLPRFNLADVAMVVGVALVLVTIIRKVQTVNA